MRWASRLKSPASVPLSAGISFRQESVIGFSGRLRSDAPLISNERRELLKSSIDTSASRKRRQWMERGIIIILLTRPELSTISPLLGELHIYHTLSHEVEIIPLIIGTHVALMSMSLNCHQMHSELTFLFLTALQEIARLFSRHTSLSVCPSTNQLCIRKDTSTPH